MLTRAKLAAAIPALALIPLIAAPSAGPVGADQLPGAAVAIPSGAPVAAPSGASMMTLSEAEAATPVLSPVNAARPAPPIGMTYVPPVPGPVARGFDPPAHDWEPGHRGVDLWSMPGAVVVAPGAGVVTFAGSVAGKPVVVVTHPDGLRSSLEPVDATVPQGTAVRAGDPVGTLAAAPGGTQNPDHCAALSPPAGSSACTHWGVRRGETYLDPLTLLGIAAPIVLLPPG